MTFNPSQPRDQDGKWTSGSGGSKQEIRSHALRSLAMHSAASLTAVERASNDLALKKKIGNRPLISSDAIIRKHLDSAAVRRTNARDAFASERYREGSRRTAIMLQHHKAPKEKKLDKYYGYRGW